MVYALQCPHCGGVKVLPEPDDEFSVDAVIDVFVELHHGHLEDGQTIQIVECPVSVNSVSSN